MKKVGLLNQPISSLIAGLGHTDAIVICDAGLPIPSESERIDLALTCGMVPFLSTLEAILGDLKVERAEVASEITERSPALHEATLKLLGAIPIDYIDHEELKRRTLAAKGIVRTGECTPFANIILYSGVTF